MTLNDSTVAFNSSTGSNLDCGGVCAGGILNNAAAINLTNTIVARNTVADSTSAPDVNGAVAASSSFNLIGNGTGMTGITNGTNGNQIGTADAPINPLLGVLADIGGKTPTHALLTGSPRLTKVIRRRRPTSAA